MAYESTCPEGFSTSSIKYYSNPDVYYEGVATGSTEANNALYMTTRKYDYSTGGTNCADGTATDKTEVGNQCAWGDGWTATPYSQCCCEGNLYAKWEEMGFSSPVCYLDIPVYGGSWVAQGKKVAYNLKDCKNLLGESISPYNTCALGKTFILRIRAPYYIFIFLSSR